MQNIMGQRTLSTLASRFHPQLPLTPRESQQLLTLLTTSFRTHLDREHPVHVSDKSDDSAVRKAVVHEDHESPRAASSYALASQHMNAVLFNPLFAVKPRRDLKTAASAILKDPMGWFFHQIATGNATLSKASMCLDMLDKRTAGQSPELYKGRTHGTIIGDWLRSSGLDTSKEFLEMCIGNLQTRRPSNIFLSRLVTLLMADGKESLVWGWYKRSWQEGLDPTKVSLFRGQLLKHMVHVEANQDLDRGILLFKKACEMIGEQTVKPYEQLGPAGQCLVQAIMSRPMNTIDHDLYNSFSQSTRLWVNSKWGQAVDSMLWLHHPTTASAAPGLRFIQDPTGAVMYVNAVRSQRRFVVQLSLGVAHQLLEEESYEDAQAVMAFIKQNFPDLVLSDSVSEKRPIADRNSKKLERERDQEKNLELLDSLALT